MNKFIRISILISICLVSLELGFRLTRPAAFDFYWLQKTYHKFDPEYFVDLEPNINVQLNHFQKFFSMKFTTNEYGFRATNKVDNSLPQIGCIGDSITMGYGVNDEDTFCKQLDGYKDDHGQQYQSINLGVDAYGPSAIALKMKKYLPKLNLKLLYYFPSSGDNVDEEVFFERKENSKARLLFETQFWLTKNSYLFLGFKVFQEQLFYRYRETFVENHTKLHKTLNCKFQKLSPEQCADTFFPSHYNFFNEFIVHKSAPPMDGVIHFPDSECKDKIDEFIIPDRMKKSIDQIIHLAQNKNIKLVMILAPIDLETAYCSQRGKQHRYYEYLHSLKNYLVSKQVDYIDMNTMTDQMKDDQGRLNPRPYYIFGDGHYTARGNQWVANLLKKKTKEILH